MPDVPRWIDPAGVPVRIFGRSVSGRWRDYAYASGVVRTLVAERENYDVVYFLMQGLHLALGLPVARWLRKPILMKISGSDIIRMLQTSRMGRLELRWLAQWAHRVMILNPGMADEAIEAGFEESRLFWMPNPVDAERYKPCPVEERASLRARLGVPAQTRVVVFTGRLAPEKELDSLIEAFSLACRTAPDALLVLVGDGPKRAELEALARRLGLDGHVRFTGRLPESEAREWLQASDLFALVSSAEGFSCSLVEAMATALPCVVSNIPANAQLIDCGVHGLLAPVRDIESIAGALTSLLCDGAARMEMGSAGRQRVLNHYTTEKVIARYEELIADALETAHHSRSRRTARTG